MSLLSEIQGEGSGRTYACMFGAFFAGLPAEDRTGLRAALADPSITSSSILRVMQRRGYKGTDDGPVVRHRPGAKTKCGTCSRDPRGVYAEDAPPKIVLRKRAREEGRS